MLFVKDYTCVILIGNLLQSREVVQTFNRTSLSERAAYGARLRESRENSRQTAKISCPCAPKIPSVTREKNNSTMLPL